MTAPRDFRRLSPGERPERPAPERGPAPASEPVARGGVAVACARQLGELVREVESFLDEQLAQLEARFRDLAEQRRAMEEARHRMKQQAPGLPPAAHESFAREQAAWQKRFDEALAQLEEERAALADAWSRLEAEERKLLAQQAAASQPATAPARAVIAAPPRKAAAMPAESAATVCRPEEPLGSPLDEAVRRSVLAQFEQLKRDVRRHVGQASR